MYVMVTTSFNYENLLCKSYMSVGGLSFGKLAIIMIAGGIGIVFLLSGFQIRDIIFAPNITAKQKV
jgi:hypothetical protein